jgi:hypothetical protein
MLTNMSQTMHNEQIHEELDRPIRVVECEDTEYDGYLPALIHHITKKPPHEILFDVTQAKVQCLADDIEPIRALF